MNYFKYNVDFDTNKSCFKNLYHSQHLSLQVQLSPNIICSAMLSLFTSPPVRNNIRSAGVFTLGGKRYKCENCNLFLQSYKQ